MGEPFEFETIPPFARQETGEGEVAHAPPFRRRRDARRRLGGLPPFAREAEWEAEFELGETETGTASVTWLQDALNRVLGLQLATDGILGPQTRSAIRDFQRREKLAVDGIAGTATQAALKSALSPASRTQAGVPGAAGSLECAGLRQPEILDNFEFARDQVRPAHLPVIQRIAQCIAASQGTGAPIRSVRLVGHADPVGSDADNVALGQRRAAQVQISLSRAIDARRPGLGGAIAYTVESKGEADPIPGNPGASRRVEVHFVPSLSPQALDRSVEDVLNYIRAEARRRAELPRTAAAGSSFVRTLSTRYLAGYLAAPSQATARTAIEAISRQNISGTVTTVCGAPDFWESATPSFNGFDVPPILRAVPPFNTLPARMGAATDILRVANRRELSHLDVPFLLGRRTLDMLDCSTRADRGRDPDLQANNGINESQLMHWATGAKMFAMGRDQLRTFFLAYELWHLEHWDVFGHDPLNDMIAEEAARHMAEQIAAVRLNRGNLIATLNAGFMQSRAWVGALLRLRVAALERQIKAEPPPSLFIHWHDEVPPTSPDHPYHSPSIRRMLADGNTVATVKASRLVEDYIDVYTLIFEAGVWERGNGAVPLTAAMRAMATGRLDRVFRAIADAERSPPTREF